MVLLAMLFTTGCSSKKERNNNNNATTQGLEQGFTECGSATCSPGQYCFAGEFCENGCVSDANCSSGDECEITDTFFGDGVCIETPVDGTNQGNTGNNQDNNNPSTTTNTGGVQTSKADIGDLCAAHDDCLTGLCVVEGAYDYLGICTETCSSWTDCSEAFWECCDVSGAGSACIPDDWVDRDPYWQCD